MATVLKNGVVIDGTGKGPIPNGFVVINGDKIEAVGPLTEFDPTAFEGPDHEVIDVGSKVIMPGLINAHAHLNNMWAKGTYQERAAQPITWLVLRAARNALLALQDGMTTVRDMASKEGTNLTIKKAVSEGMIVGPRVVACGQAICMTGGHGYQKAIEADGPDEVRKAARRLLKAGADFIKLMASDGLDQLQESPPPQLSEDEMRAAFEEAKKAGKKTTVHAHPPAAIRAAVAAGVDCVEHGGLMDKETADLLAREGVYLVPTVGEAWGVAYRGVELGRPAWLIEACRQRLEPRMKTFELSVQAGIKMAVGTDVSASMALEMELMQRGGLSAMEVLVAATRNGAEVCDLADQIGTLEVGKLADLIVIDGNPLKNMGDMRKVDLVFKEGKMYRPADLAKATGIHIPLP
jgi:imidazolonepropionase-like amidohydrolase